MESNTSIQPPAQRDDFADTLDQIRVFIKEHGYPPTVRELCSITGVKSTSAMSYRLQRLANMGHIKLTPHIARGIALRKEEISP